MTPVARPTAMPAAGTMGAPPVARPPQMPALNPNKGWGERPPMPMRPPVQPQTTGNAQVRQSPRPGNFGVR